MAGNVKQQGYDTTPDASTRTIAMNRSGGVVTTDPAAMYDQWLRGGKVFSAHFATEGGTSTIEANATVDLTEPLFRLTVPSSKIVVPIYVNISTVAVKVTGDAIFMTTSEGDTYTSGGAAPQVNNLTVLAAADSAINSATSSCTNVFDGDSALTEAALVNPRQFGSKFFKTGGLFADYEYNILKGDPMVMIHGLSSWQIQGILTGALECLYEIVWAELDKSELVNS